MMTPTERQLRRGWGHSGSDPPDKPRRRGPMVHSFSGYIFFFLGAGLGGALRHGVNGAALRLLGSGFPYGTLTVNIVGSLTIGVLAGWFAHKADPGQAWRLFLTKIGRAHV